MMSEEADESEVEVEVAAGMPCPFRLVEQLQF